MYESSFVQQYVYESSFVQQSCHALSLSLSLSICLSVCLSLSLSVSVYAHQYTCVPLSLFFSTNSRNNLYVPRPRLDLFKTSISFAGASFWNSLPQNIKSCTSLPSFKPNLHKYIMFENNLWSKLERFV